MTNFSAFAANGVSARARIKEHLNARFIIGGLKLLSNKQARSNDLSNTILNEPFFRQYFRYLRMGSIFIYR
jgi:hypothetical protein